MPPVNHDHVDVRFSDQRVHECHSSGTSAYNEVVGLDLAHPASLRQTKVYSSLSGCRVEAQSVDEPTIRQRTAKTGAKGHNARGGDELESGWPGAGRGLRFLRAISQWLSTGHETGSGERPPAGLHKESSLN